MSQSSQWSRKSNVKIYARSNVTKRRNERGAMPATPIKRIRHRRFYREFSVRGGVVDAYGKTRRPLHRRRNSTSHRDSKLRRRLGRLIRPNRFQYPNRERFSLTVPSIVSTTKRWKSTGGFRTNRTATFNRRPAGLCFRPWMYRNRVWLKNGVKWTISFGRHLWWRHPNWAGRKSRTSRHHFRLVTTASTSPDCHRINAEWLESETTWKYRTTSGINPNRPSHRRVPTISGWMTVVSDPTCLSTWTTKAYRPISITISS